MGREGLTLWSVGLADSVTVRDGRDDDFERIDLLAELAANAEGDQLYLLRRGSYRAARADSPARSAAARAYRDRYHRDPVKVRHTTFDPDGEKDTLGIIFEIRYTDNDGQAYFHRFKPPRPYLQEYETGQLWIDGGSYRVTGRGIVG